MESNWREAVWGQFGAAIDSLENAIGACPEEVWGDRSRQPEVWYLVYHTLFWLDFYLTASEESFKPPPPFNLDELDPAGLLPDRVYSKTEMLKYLEYGRQKARRLFAALSDENPGPRYKFRWGEVSYFELQLYNMRHVQHAAAQMNLILRQETDSAPGWVGKVKDGLV